MKGQTLPELFAVSRDYHVTSLRLDAVSDLMSLGSVVGGVREVLRTLPDLQRLLRK